MEKCPLVSKWFCQSGEMYLKSERVAECQEQSERPFGFVRAVGPKPVGPAGDSETSQLVEKYRWNRIDRFLSLGSRHDKDLRFLCGDCDNQNLRARRVGTAKPVYIDTELKRDK